MVTYVQGDVSQYVLMQFVKLRHSWVTIDISGYTIRHDITACLDKRKYVLIVLIEFPIGSRSDPNVMTWVPNLKRLCMCRYICICYETLITNWCTPLLWSMIMMILSWSRWRMILTINLISPTDHIDTWQLNVAQGGVCHPKEWSRLIQLGVHD